MFHELAFAISDKLVCYSTANPEEIKDRLLKYVWDAEEIIHVAGIENPPGYHHKGWLCGNSYIWVHVRMRMWECILNEKLTHRAAQKGQFLLKLRFIFLKKGKARPLSFP